jgi:hypothetical protein
MTSPPLIADSSAADGFPDDTARKRRWLIGIWVVVALFAMVTAVRSHQVGVPVRDPEGEIFRWRIAKSLALFGVLMLVDASIRTGRAGWSVEKVRAQLRRRWPKDRLAIALSGLLAYHLVYLCYRNLKSWLAFRATHDDLLLRVDRWLFFDHSPAVLLHDLFGQHWAAYVFAAIYRSFTYLVPFSLAASLVFSTRIREGYVFLASAMWVWILGVGSYYLIPAIGPFDSAPREFSHLPHTAITETQVEYTTERAQILHHPAAADSFSSIGAFASLHIAFTFMVLLMLRYYGFRRAVRAITVYLIAVAGATIYLGWHFAIDDVAGLVVAFLAVLFGRLMIHPRGRGSP